MLLYLDRYKLLIFNILFFFFIFKGDAQTLTKAEKKDKAKADLLFESGDYLNASNYYLVLFKKDSLDEEFNYKIGVCYFELKRFRKNAINYFSKTSLKRYPETYFYLGRLNHISEKYELAIENYKMYLKMNRAGEYSESEINFFINKSKTAQELQKQMDNTVVITNLGENINTEFSEYSPLIPADESFLLFTSRRKNEVWKNKDPNGDYFEDIYISYKKNNEWTSPQLLDTNVNTSLHDACTGLSADGEKLLVYKTNKDLYSGGIYESNIIENKWSTPKIMDNKVNSLGNLETSACYSPDGEIIIFSSNRKGGYGGMDLYMIKKTPTGEWSEAKNLGPTINTEYNEDAPFIHPLGKTLYFSSEGHLNMGGYDVFKSNFNEYSDFTPPENLGCPINTADDDIFFVMNTNANMGYFSSDRNGGIGLQDIYSVTFPNENSLYNVYNIHVVDQNDSTIKNVDVTLIDLTKKTVHGVYKSNKNTGKILVISKNTSEFKIMIESKGYSVYSNNILFKDENDLVFKLKKTEQ